MSFRKQLAHRSMGWLAFAVLVPGPLPSLTPAPERGSAYKIQRQWKLGGEGGWQQMAIDSERRRLYVTRTNRVSVVDTRSGNLLGEIPGFEGIRGICLDPRGTFGYVTDGPAGAVMMFDLASLKIVATLAVGANPEAIVFEPATQHVLVFNNKSKSVSIADAACSKVLETVALPGRPGSAVVDGKGSVYVNIVDSGAVIKIDANTRQIAATWPLSGCVGPSGMAIDRLHERIFSVCENRKLISTNMATGKQAGISALSGGSDAMFDSRQQSIFVANSEGSLSVVHEISPDRYAVAQTVKTLPGARTLALDTITQNLFLCTAQFGLRTGPDISEELRFRPTPVAGSFVVLVVGR
jgi:DNA-binding beta-propeller fold protein YncE